MGTFLGGQWQQAMATGHRQHFRRYLGSSIASCFPRPVRPGSAFLGQSRPVSTMPVAPSLRQRIDQQIVQDPASSASGSGVAGDVWPAPPTGQLQAMMAGPAPAPPVQEPEAAPAGSWSMIQSAADALDSFGQVASQGQVGQVPPLSAAPQPMATTYVPPKSAVRPPDGGAHGP